MSRVARRGSRLVVAAAALAAVAIPLGCGGKEWTLPEAPTAAQRTFYVAHNGDDASPGTSPERAWRTVGRVNTARLQPGDAVLFEQSDAPGRVLVEGNEIAGVRRSGVYLDGSTVGDFVISGNRIDVADGAPGIDAERVPALTIAGNTIAAAHALAIEPVRAYSEHDNALPGGATVSWSGRELSLADYRSLSHQGAGDTALSGGRPPWFLIALLVALLPAAYLVVRRARSRTPCTLASRRRARA